MPVSMDFSGGGSGAEDNENPNAGAPTGPQMSPINPPASPSFPKDGLLSFSPVHPDSPPISPVTQVDPVTVHWGKSNPTRKGRHYVDGLPDMTLGQHEEAHAYQSQTLGPIFVPWWFALGGESAKNPFEKSADYYGAGKGGPFSAFDEGLLGNFKNFKK